MTVKKLKIQEEPAWGERNAVTGYYPQYRMSAALVIQGLRSRSLRWIAVADPQAKRVDDFQIAAENRVDAYQFKWSRYPGNFTFNDLVKGDDSSPSLIKQLAEGWQHLQKLYVSERIVVHLITNETMSVSASATLPTGDPPPDHPHFAAFIEQVWKPAHNTPISSSIKILTVWQTTWSSLQKESGLSKKEFERFVRDCKLEFGCGLPDAEYSADSRDKEIYENDLNHVTEKIFRAVYEPQQIVRLNHQELLEFLGWKRRFEFRNRHDFPVNDVLYQPIEESRSKLEQALTQIESGYLAVLGSPGSGKSTLLTQTLLYYPQRIIRYYAFVPDAQGANVRGDSQNFLHDIVGALEKAGFVPGLSPSTSDTGHLRERFHQQLQLLHQDWLKTNRKTIILVDGLDHIPREQRPVQSLLKDLPVPDQIPAGVLFVLGSQTDELTDLPTAVQTAIRRSERRIEIKTLNRESMQRIIEKADLKTSLTAEQITRIENLSGGHPLALIYLLKQLETANSLEETNKILQNTAPYDGKIEDYYQSFWRTIHEEDELALLLGLIARMRGGIDFKWVHTWAERGLVRRLQRLFGHLFRVEADEKWYFFHNSFRLFLVSKTAGSASGRFEADQDREIHLELAAKFAQAGEPHLQWEEIYHLHQAGADDKLLKKADSVYFREQFFNLRSPEAIRADILLAIRAAGRQRDVSSLVREMLADSEIAQRESNTERQPIVPILISLGETTAALEYLRDGRRLRVSPKIALENAIPLKRNGFEQDALAIFESGEPLDYLSGAKTVKNFYDEDEHGLLENWAQAVVYFRPIEKIIDAIRQVAVETERFVRQPVAVTDEAGESQISIEAEAVEEFEAETESDTATQKLQNKLFYVAGLELIIREKWAELEILKATLINDEISGKDYRFSLQVYSWRYCRNQGDSERARQFVTETVERIDSFIITDSKRIVIAEAFLTVFGDKKEARRWLEQAQPLTPLTFSDFHVSFTEFDRLLRHAKLLYAFGESRSPEELIPLPAEAKAKAGAFCQRGVCVIAEIIGAAWRGQYLDSSSLRLKTFPLLRMFNRRRLDDRDEWSAWYPFIDGIKNEFYERLIAAVALHGKEAVQDLAADFAGEWQNNRRYWETETIQRIILALFANGVERNWATRQLEHLAELIAEDETYSRIEKSFNLTDARLRIGDTETARKTLLHTLLDSSSTGEKDYQLNTWLDWLRRINRIEPENGAARVAWFAEAIVALERNGGPAASAAYELLEIVFEWSPRRAIKLFSWFIEKGIIHFDDAAKSLLRGALNVSGMGISKIAILFLYEFILPFGKPDKGIIKLILTRLLQKNGKESVLNFAKEFLGKVEIIALPTSRKIWSRLVAEFLSENDIALSEVGLDEEIFKARDEYSGDNHLNLKDGTSLTNAEVRRRCQDLAGLREIMEQKNGTYYHWEEVVQNLLPKLKNSAEVLEVVKYFSGTEENLHAPIINRLARRLSELGDSPNAVNLAESVLASSEQSGWSTHLSGGTKIGAYKTLVKIEGEAIRRRAFDNLIRDLSGDYRYTSSIVRDLNEILPVLTAQVPEKEIWSEVEQYVQSIFSSVKPEEIDSAWLDLENENEIPDTLVNGLQDFVAHHIAHPINILSYAAQFVFLELLLQGDQAAENTLNRLLLGNEREQEAVTMILDAASIKNPQIAGKFENGLLALSASPNMALRFVAYKLLGKIGISTTLRQKPKTDSLTLYNFELPPGRSTSQAFQTKTAETEYDFLPDTNDSYQLLKIVLMELEFIAAGAGLPRENVIERAAQIFAQVAAKDEWSLLGEQKMRNRFNVADLKYSYRRPRATIAHFALFHLIAELFDAGYLASEHLDKWKWILQHYDPETFFLRPVSRPEFIAPISGWGQRDFVKREPAEIADEVKLFTKEGLVVFGEYTKVKSLEWETPTVIRQAMICPETHIPRNDRYRFFPAIPILQIADYPQQSNDDGQYSILIWHWERMPNTPNAEWLAFNPEIARALGWKASADKPFRWLADDGEMMVWSVFWQDGLFQEQPPEFHNEVGEGFAVVGTLRALEEIKKYAQTALKQKIRVEEKWSVDGEKKKNSFVVEREIT